ncbi:terpene synthase [Solwaraspora sp. WMMD406]|uniref:terpene synthase family protein n=1 Tax=Solwaraspora sp. WMMD406 TaxID=3016095 RepID=UPI0024164765|nr:terpene synthase [Solwaraspora sp. WMMD406]MDG4765376.1 terpene synthase [Solwaraspora sp. WMMD406]
MRAPPPPPVVAPPFRSRLNPHHPTVAMESLSWAARFGLTADPTTTGRLGRANAAELASRAGPAAGKDGLRLLSDLITWLFALDDVCDEDGSGADPGRLSPLLSPLMQTLDHLGDDVAGCSASPPPLAAALGDICRRIRQQGHPGTLLRFAALLHHYLFALIWEAGNRHDGRVPAVAEYVQMRRHSGAVLPSFALTDLAVDGLPQTRHRVDQRLVRLNTVAADLVCWCNDLFSYSKEYGHDPHNLATVIAYETGHDPAAALVEAADRFNDGLALYLRLERDVLTDAPPAVVRYVDTRRCWIRGTYDWSRNSTRYQWNDALPMDSGAMPPAATDVSRRVPR